MFCFGNVLCSIIYDSITSKHTTFKACISSGKLWYHPYQMRNDPNTRNFNHHHDIQFQFNRRNEPISDINGIFYINHFYCKYHLRCTHVDWMFHFAPNWYILNDLLDSCRHSICYSIFELQFSFIIWIRSSIWNGEAHSHS